MLLYPPIDEIKLKADSRYTLVVMAAKRARDLVARKPALVDIDNNVPISIAAEEIMKDEITYRRPVREPSVAVSAPDAETAEA
ncbi:MAG: DNA-directed RNA polymerase subunit omega [Clostridiales Family XIII bacterium]|jgi:DNA-directed RNA polymerase subunit omega|nr:DNA-directed RNA polymerase subunit omega [Clostridiales Family XIII bacterium]